MYLYRLQLK